MSTAPPAATMVKTATVMVAGKSEQVLTSTAGRTLYYFVPDTAHTVACTGTCAKTWPPQLVPASGQPTGAALPGTLTTLNGANGTQAEYNGHPLYTYSGDAAQGDTHGQGLFGKWFVATPQLAQNGSGGGGGSPTPTSGAGY